MNADQQRLNQLLDLQTRIEAEIEVERATLIRIRKVRRDTLASISRGAWNQRVFTACCHHWGVEIDHVLSGARNQAAVDARHAFMWLMRVSGRSYPEIGTELGMDHTSAMNGVRRVEGDPRIQAAAAEIHLALTGETTTTARARGDREMAS